MKSIFPNIQTCPDACVDDFFCPSIENNGFRNVKKD